MPKRILFLSFTLACLLWLAPVHAQFGWQAWLYDYTDARMTRVNDAGFVEDFVLPIPTGYDLAPQRVAVGHGGSPFAYTVTNSSTFQGQLVVSNSDLSFFNVPLPATLADSLQYVANELVFDETNASLAIGYALTGGGWQIAIVDFAGNAISQTLRSDDPLVAVLGLPTQQGIMPVVQRYQARTVTFTMVLTGTEAAPSNPSYHWNLDTNAVTADIAYPTLDNDTLVSTGEVVMSLPDERLPNTANSFPFFQSNALHVYDPVQNARYPFYNQPDKTLHVPRFVQGGERVLVASSDASGTATAWLVIERSGVLVGSVPSPAEIASAEGVPDGFVYTSASITPGAITLVYVNTRDGLDAGVPVWTSAPGGVPIIMWTDNTSFASQSVLPGWTQLAAPVTGTGDPLGGMTFDAGGGAVIVAPVDLPTTAPSSGGILTVGGQATINTTEGDTLNVRAGPGTSYEIVARLPDGARVTLIEGPRAGEGFTWWRIRAGNTEGWVVESVDDRGTRLQTLIP